MSHFVPIKLWRFICYISLFNFHLLNCIMPWKHRSQGLTKVEGGTESHTCTHGINQACQKGDWTKETPQSMSPKTENFSYLQATTKRRPTNDFNDIIHGGVFNMDFLNMNPQNTWTNCSFGRRASISTSPLQEGPIGVVWHHWHQVMTNDLFGKSKLTNGMLYRYIYIIAVCPSSRSEEYCTHPFSRSKLRYL